MTSIAAAIGRVQLERLPEFTRFRREHAALLTEALEDLPGIYVPIEPADRRHVYHQYTVRCDERERLRERLDAAGVESAVYYPTPIHRQPAYGEIDQDFPVAEGSSRQVLSLPVHPSLTRAQIRTIAETVQDAIGVEEAVVDV